MERTLEFTFTDPQRLADEAAKYLAPLELSHTEKSVIVCLIAHGERIDRQGQRLTQFSQPKSRLKQYSGISGTAFIAAAQALAAQGLMAVVQATSPWLYVLNLDRLAKLQPRPAAPLDPLAGLLTEWQPRSPPVTPVTPPRDSVIERSSKIRDTCPDVNRDTCAAPTADRPRRWPKPWDRAAGCQSADLRAAVVRGDRDTLRELYREAVALGWIEDSTDAKVRFLAICHHAATCANLGSPMGVLVARTKRQLDVTNLRQSSDDWAARMLAGTPTRVPSATAD